MVNKNYEIIRTSYLFDDKWYSKKYLKGKSDNPIKHYVEIGYKGDFNPSPHFNNQWYLKKNPDVKNKGVIPLVHYILHGRKEGRLPNPSFNFEKLDEYNTILYSGLFDEEWFSKYYSLDKSRVNLVKYYVEDYLNYGLNPSPDFDSMWYLEKYDDVKKSKLNPFVHYIKYGKKEGRKPKWDK